MTRIHSMNVFPFRFRSAHREVPIKRFLATASFLLHRKRVLLIFLALTAVTSMLFLLVQQPTNRVWRTPGGSFSLRRAASDPCFHAIPEQLIHFDPPSRVSSEFDDPVLSDIDPPSMHRIFTTFFNRYLFQMRPSHILSITDAGRGRLTDIRDSLVFAQRALQIFDHDTSIKVRNYSLGYNHLDRVRGSRYVFHLISQSDTDTARRDVVTIQRTFDSKCYISVKTYLPAVLASTLFIVVPYSNRPARLKWFLSQFDNLVERDLNITLILAVCRENAEDLDVVYKLVATTAHHDRVRIVPTPGDTKGVFSRAVSIREGVSHVDDDSIIFLSDVDMYIFPTMFDSCRLNSIQGSQVYFPVFYSLYPGNTRINRRAGYWRDSSFGMSCMYRSDFAAVAAYEKAEESFSGWGGEDEALYYLFRNDSRYEIFRAIEPALRHKWHAKLCEKSSSAYHDCLVVKYQQIGEMATIGELLLEKKVDAQDLFADSEDDGDLEQSVGEGEKASLVRSALARVTRLSQRKQLLLKIREAASNSRGT